MHKTLLFLFLITAFTARAQDDILLSGQVLNPTSRYVHLSRLSGLMLQEGKHDSVKLDEQGRFLFNLDWLQPRDASFWNGDETARLFLTPGDRLVLTVDTKDFENSLKFTGTGSSINTYMARQTQASSSGLLHLILANSKPEAQFVRIADSAHTAELALLQQQFKANSGKAEQAFVRHQKNEITYEWARRRLEYTQFHNPAPVSPGYYTFLKEVSLDPTVITSPFEQFSLRYATYLGQEAVRKQPALKDANVTLVEYQEVEKHFKGQPRRVVLACLLRDAMMYEPALAPLRPAYDRFLKEPGLEPELRELISSKWQVGEKLATGMPAPDFMATGIDNKPVKLSDFKGKIVFVDIWASWCAPCIKEIPAAKELETAFHGKDVVFLNVSIDETDAVWRKTVEKHSMQGLNVRATKGWESDIVKNYNIGGIPRYVLIDRKGNLINHNAENPSNNARQAIADALEN
jgi:thiol-disulfide isomerase/thioredoxin